MPFNLGGPELMVILVIVLIVFGAGKLPNVMRDLGAGVREFKKAQTDDDTMSRATTMTSVTPATPAAPTAPPTSTTVTTTQTAPAPTSSETPPRPVETSSRA